MTVNHTWIHESFFRDQDQQYKFQEEHLGLASPTLWKMMLETYQEKTNVLRNLSLTRP